MTHAMPDSARDHELPGGVRHERPRKAAGVGAWTMALARSALIHCCTVAAMAFVSPAVAQDAQPYQVPIDADGVQRVTIVGGSYFFKPERIVAKAGRPLELLVSMEQGIVPHRFLLEGADGKPLADVELTEEPKAVRVELAAGDYVFQCPNRLLMFKSHRQRGMSGVLEVRE